MATSQDSELEPDASEEAQIIGRGEIVPLAPTKRELNLAKAMDAEDSRFKTLLQKSGITDERAEFVSSLQKLHGQFFSQSIDFLNGGLTVLGEKVLRMTEQLSEKIAQLPQPWGDPEQMAAMAQYEIGLREAHSRNTENFIKIHVSGMNGALIRAKVEEHKRKSKNMEGTGIPRGKPAFSPQVQKTEVHVHGQNSKIEVTDSLRKEIEVQQ